VVLAASTALLGAAVVTLGLTSPPASAPVAAAVDSTVTDAAAAAYPTVEDHCYIEGMIPHHEQALELSSLVLDASGVGGRTRALAEFIVADQSGEIQTMRAWQDAWRQAIPAGAGFSGGGHGDHGSAAGVVPSGCGDHAHTGMGGMATPEQLAALDAAESLAAERLFLELMIVHHEGALDMATRAVTEASNAFVRTSGKHVLVEQAREIDAMTDLLASMP
jgi:uncharacterized protein (DUF305 family)